jgi:hypothetical protein
MVTKVNPASATGRQDLIRERAYRICEAERAGWLSREHWDRAVFELENEPAPSLKRTSGPGGGYTSTPSPSDRAA